MVLAFGNAEETVPESVVGGRERAILPDVGKLHRPPLQQQRAANIYHSHR